MESNDKFGHNCENLTFLHDQIQGKWICNLIVVVIEGNHKRSDVTHTLVHLTFCD